MQRMLLAKRLIICVPVSSIFLLAAMSVLPIRPPPPWVVSTSGILFVVLLVRTIRMSCVASDSGVVIRNLLRTHRANWTEVSRVDLGSTVHAPRHWQARSKTIRFWIGGRPVCAQACCDASAEDVRQISAQGKKHGVDVSRLKTSGGSGRAWEHERRPGVVSPSGLLRLLRHVSRRQPEA